MIDINLDELPAYIEGLQAEIDLLHDLLGDILQRAMLPEDIEQRVREALDDE